MKIDSLIPLAARVQNVRAYAKGGGARLTDLRLDKNEGVAPPLSIEVNGDLLDSRLLNQYPNDSALRNEIAAEFQLAADEVIVTAGADDALDRVCRILVEAGRNVVLPTPTFEMIERYVALAEGRAKRVPWKEGAFPVAQVLAAVDADTAAIFVVSPNNPTGLTATLEDLQELSCGAPKCALILDLAYAEFGESLPAELFQIPNLIITRTFSKAWGLAGLRVGIALAPKPLADAMSAAAGPYPVSALSLEIARRQWLNQREGMEKQVQQTSDIRNELESILDGFNLRPQPSLANFVLCRPDNPQWIYDGLAGMGIAVRSFQGVAELEGCLRFGCPESRADLARLEAALSTVVKPEAMLFDMDGVLADVSQSFRIAIRETCAEYGVAVDASQIEALKLAGGFNNDWVVTQELLRQNGKSVSLAIIREVFDRIYLGEPIGTGLCATEKLLIDKSKLEALARKFPLAVVTGRPRADAQMFLRSFNLSETFSTIIAMEDAESKPNPAPVRKALEQLNINRAWMIGDSVDDIRAARSAGVLPIGVLAPGSNPTRQSSALLQAGAARVLDQTEALMELLS